MSNVGLHILNLSTAEILFLLLEFLTLITHRNHIPLLTVSQLIHGKMNPHNMNEVNPTTKKLRLIVQN